MLDYSTKINPEQITINFVNVLYDNGWIKNFISLGQAYNTLSLEAIENKAQANYWKTLHQRAITREGEYKKEIEDLKAKLRLREQQLFGKKTEKSTKKTESSKETKPAKPRGQQKGSRGHGRTDNSHLPTEVETIDLPSDQQRCPTCKLPFKELSITEESTMVTIVEVKAHQRKIRRKKYKPTCHCNDFEIITAPPVPKLIPKSKIDIPIWIKILVEKYDYQRPLYRLLKCFRDYGLYLAQGTITDGLKKITNLFLPIYNVIQEKCLEDKHWHADESRWSVFEKVEDKTGYRWYLWVFKSSQAVIFKIAPSRSSQVARDFFVDTKTGSILSVDRYIAYKVIAKEALLILAFCWAHVRRDFISHAKEYPEQETWTFEWRDLINELFHINNQRIKHEKDSDTFINFDSQLRNKIQLMEKKYLAQLDDESTHDKSEKVLESLKNHWDGLTVFVDYPEIPMDNNAAERQLRNPIIGRKNYYGSGSVWSSELSAMLFSIFDTLKLWKINTSGWLSSYLSSCANNGGKSPADVTSFLPWNMEEEQKAKLSRYWDSS